MSRMKTRSRVKTRSRSKIILLGSPLAFFLLAFFLTTPAALADANTDAKAKAGHAAVNAWLEAWNTGTGNLESFLTEDVTYNDPFSSPSDRQGYRALIFKFLAVFRDVEFTANDVILDGDRGAVTWTLIATSNNSGRATHIRGVSILHFRDGKIATEWKVYDAAELMRQITALPDGDGSNSTSD